jgi:hypothetical protein
VDEVNVNKCLWSKKGFIIKSSMIDRHHLLGDLFLDRSGHGLVWLRAFCASRRSFADLDSDSHDHLDRVT